MSKNRAYHQLPDRKNHKYMKIVTNTWDICLASEKKFVKGEPGQTY